MPCLLTSLDLVYANALLEMYDFHSSIETCDTETLHKPASMLAGTSDQSVNMSERSQHTMSESSSPA